MPKDRSGVGEDGPIMLHARHGFGCKEHQIKSSNNRIVINMVEVVDYRSMEGVDILFLAENSVAEAVYYQVNSSDK